jgi:hypothetical protein
MELAAMTSRGKVATYLNISEKLVDEVGKHCRLRSSR